MRAEDEIAEKSLHLADVPFDRLDEVIPMIERWGEFAEYENHDLSGQFIYDPRQRRAGFEVVIHEPED